MHTPLVQTDLHNDEHDAIQCSCIMFFSITCFSCIKVGLES